MTEIRVPTLGESVSEATIGKWFKKPGDAVRKDEPLVELETDKVTLEVNAPEAGVLGEITAKEGETVGVNALLGQITAGGAGAAAAAPAAAPKAETPKAEAPKAAPPKAEAPAATAMPPAPAAAKMMAETGVAVDAGSGKRGQVLKEDVMAAIARGGSAPRLPPPRRRSPAPRRRPATRRARSASR